MNFILPKEQAGLQDAESESEEGDERERVEERARLVSEKGRDGTILILVAIVPVPTGSKELWSYPCKTLCSPHGYDDRQGAIVVMFVGEWNAGAARLGICGQR